MDFNLELVMVNGLLIASIPFIFQHGMRAIDSITGNGIWVGWYFAWGIIFGAIFLFSKFQFQSSISWNGWNKLYYCTISIIQLFIFVNSLYKNIN